MGARSIGRPRVAFVCTHNACRSQMAEAIARQIAGDVLDPCSAGTDPAPEVDPGALRALSELYGIDGTGLRPKTLDVLGEADIVVTMGCGVRCPVFPCAHREDWGLEDPAGRGPEEFRETARVIEARVRDLACRVERGEIPGVTAPVRADVLRALADERRLAVVASLAEGGETCACELLEGLGIGQPTLSHHMKLLTECGLVSARKDGRWLRYTLDRERISALGDALKELAR